MASKLTYIINEKIEKINPEKILTDLTNNTDKDTIAEFVNSKSKDDRIAIAANPNLTIEQQTKLANDKVNGVRQALCYNKNLDYDLAKQLLEEEPERIDFISQYGGPHLDDFFFEYVPADKIRWRISSLLKSEMKPETIEKIVKEYPDATILGNDFKSLTRQKNLTPETVKFLFNAMVENPRSNAYNGLTSLIFNHTDVLDEKFLKKTDWKNNKTLKEALMLQDNLSEDFYIDIVNNLQAGENSSSFGTMNRTGGDKALPKAFKSIRFLNAYLEFLATKADVVGYHAYELIGKAANIPLNPKHLMAVAKKLQGPGGGNAKSQYMSNITKNIAFPDYAFDELVIQSKESLNNYGDPLKEFLASPGITQKRAEEYIMKYVTDSKSAETALWGVSENKKLKLSKEIQLKLLKELNTKGYWFERVVRGDLLDEVVNDVSKWTEYLKNGDAYGGGKLKHQIYLYLSKNPQLTSAQKKQIIELDSNLPADDKNTWTEDRVIKNVTIDHSTDIDLFLELIEKQPENIWLIWTDQGYTYFQYTPDQQKAIDKLALKISDAPKKVLTGINNKNFTSWVNYNNDKDDNAMSEDTAVEYLLHFIKTGSDEIKALLKSGFVDDVWLKNTDVTSAMYELTGDEKYISDVAKDIFLF